jgi:hypothetical protein
MNEEPETISRFWSCLIVGTLALAGLIGIAVALLATNG